MPPEILRPPPLTPAQIAAVLDRSNRKPLYENIRKGSFDHIQQIRDATHGSRDPDVLKVILESLRNIRVPERIEMVRRLPDAVSRSRTAVCAMSVMEDQCRNCSADPELLKVTGALIHEFWSALVGWFKFFFVTGTHLFQFLELGPVTVMKSPIINLMSIMKAYDGSDFDLRYLPRSLEIFIYAWNCRDEDGSPIVIAKDGFSDGICPILTILQRCTERDDVREQLLLKMITKSFLPLNVLPDTFVSRVLSLKRMYIKREVKGDWLVAYIHRLTRVTLDIAANNLVRHALLGAGFLHIYLDALFLVAKDDQNNLDLTGWYMMGQAASNLLRWVLHETDTVATCFVDLIKGNYLGVTIRTLTHLPQDEDLFQSSLRSVDLIVAYSTNPPILSALQDSMEEVIGFEKPIVTACGKSAGLRKSLASLIDCYNQNAECAEGRWRQTSNRRFCDNMSHHRLHGFQRFGTVSKTCSKCRSVLYCSKECQTQDWFAFHKLECSGAANQYRDLKATNYWIKHDFRNYYYSLMEEWVSRARALILGLPSSSSGLLIPVFDTSFSPYDIRTITIPDFRERGPIYKFRQKRLQAFIDEYEDRKRGRFLVGGVFVYGKEKMHILARIVHNPGRFQSEIEADDEVDTAPFQIVGVLVHHESLKGNNKGFNDNYIWSLNQNYNAVSLSHDMEALRRRKMNDEQKLVA